MPEFELVATQLRHDKTGAEHLHIAQAKNNVFAIGFGTPSKNSTGIAHILVCLYKSQLTTGTHNIIGSKRYPVRTLSLKCSIVLMPIS